MTDADLREFERAFKSNPSDEDAEARYFAALVRLGEVQSRPDLCLVPWCDVFPGHD